MRAVLAFSSHSFITVLVLVSAPVRSGTRSAPTTSSWLHLEGLMRLSLYSHITQVAAFHSVFVICHRFVCMLSSLNHVCLLFLVLSISPSWSPTALEVKTVPASVEGLGMASSLMSSGQLLLTGGCSRGGRGPVTRALLRGPDGWTAVSVQASADLSEETV